MFLMFSSRHVKGGYKLNARSGDFGGDTNRKRKRGAARGDDQGCVEETMPPVLRHPWSFPVGASLFLFLFVAEFCLTSPDTQSGSQ